MITYTAESVNWEAEIDIDPDILDGDDAFMETATQGVEHARKNIKEFQCGAYIEVIRRNKNGSVVVKFVNAYWVLVNAAAYALAENLREGYLKNSESKSDLKLEPQVSPVNPEPETPPSS